MWGVIVRIAKRDLWVDSGGFIGSKGGWSWVMELGKGEGAAGNFGGEGCRNIQKDDYLRGGQ